MLPYTWPMVLDHSTSDGAVKSGRTQKLLMTSWSRSSHVPCAVTGLKMEIPVAKRVFTALERTPLGKLSRYAGPANERADYDAVLEVGRVKMATSL